LFALHWVSLPFVKEICTQKNNTKEKEEPSDLDV